MNGDQKRAWAWRQPLAVGDQATLQALVDETDTRGEGVLDAESIEAKTGHGPRGLSGALQTLADKGLVRGLRWTQNRGWDGSKIRLNLAAEPHVPRHLRAVA